MKLIIHGGFFSEASSDAATRKAKQDSLSEIVTSAANYLKTSSALETVVFTVTLLENNELFNAGKGSQIQADGKIRMSASIMDGATMKFSGVINIEDVKNPIRVAEKLLSYDDRVLEGAGALHFARKTGFNYFNPETSSRRTEYEHRLKSSGLGTVGCVALDDNGHLAAATSTGGKGFEIPGRVSDSATTAGNYANEFAAVSCTGVGEDIVSAALASSIVFRISDGATPDTAIQKSFHDLSLINGFAGAIGIDQKGNVFHRDSHPYMVWAKWDGQVDIFK